MRAADLDHLRAAVPLRFPEFALMPESTAHLILRTFLYELLRYVLGPEHSIGSDQFVYWAPNNPAKCLAPDLFVKLDVPQLAFGTWKCWEHGAPQLAVEIVSASDSGPVAWEEKLERYVELGAQELLRFDPDQKEGQRLRAWDRIDGDFVERVVLGDTTPCLLLGLSWVVCPVDVLPVGLRLVDADGEPVATRVEAAEAARKAADSARQAADTAREAADTAREAADSAREAADTARVSADTAREAAEARVRELEEELRRRR